MWFRKKADLTKDFDVTANLYFGTSDGGADGITFTFQDQCTSAGTVGGSLGIGGVTPSLIAEFDTYQNTGEMAADHIGIQKNGDLSHAGSNKLVDPVPALANSGNIEDGQYHTARITWTASSKTLKVYFDGAERISYSGDVVKDIFGGSPYVYWGFTAATGGLNNEHRVCISSFPNNVVKLSDVTICEGDTAKPTLPGGTSYSWTPNYNISNNNTSSPKLYPTVTTKYIVSISDACNNIQKDSLIVTVNLKATVTLNDFNDVCAGSSAFTLSGGSPAGGTYSGTGVSAGKFNPSVTGAGTFNITYSYTNINGCTATATKSIKVNNAPVVTLADFTPVCVNSPSFGLTGGSPAGGTYSGTGVSGNNFNPASAGPGNFTISYSYTDANGCSTISQKNITVYDKPSATITTPNGTVICSGTAITLQASAGTGLQYQWFNNASALTTLSSGNATYSASVPGNYTLRVVNANGCEVTSSALSVTTGSTPTASISSSATDFCPGDSVQLTTNLNAGESVEWLLNGNVVPLQSGSGYKISTAGTYNTRITSSDGCKAISSDLVITQKTGPSASILSERPAFCPEVSSILLTANNEPTATYTWYKDNSLIPSANSQTYSSTSAASYTVKVSLPNGCTKTSSPVNLVNATNPGVSLTIPQTSFCEGSSVTLTATNVSGGQYSWYKSGSVVSGANTNSLNVTTGGNYIAKVTSTLGCVGVSDTAKLTMKPLPIATISAPLTTICQGNSTVITANIINGATYEWFKNNTSLGSPTSGQNTLTVNQSGAYKVKINDGCTATSNTVNILVNSSPSAAGAISGITTFCAGQYAETFSISSVSNATDYLWEITPANKASIASGQGTNSITVNFLNQSVTIKVTPRNSCGTGSPATTTVSVDNGGFCTFDASFGAYPTNTCKGSTVSFTDFSQNSQFGYTTYWNFGSGASPSTATGAGPVNVTYSTTGKKTVTIQYKDMFGNVVNQETRIDYINVSGAVTTSAISGNANLTDCQGTETYSVTNTIGSSYSWTVPSGASILSGNGTNSITVQFNFVGGDVSVTETNAAGCQGTSVKLNVSCPITTSAFDQYNTLSILKIYPNPSKDVVTIDAYVPSGSESKISIHDITGQEVFTTPSLSTIEIHETLDLSHLNKGIYLVKITTNEKTVMQKLILE